jgi:putative transposase
MIQGLDERSLSMARFDLTDFEWSVIQPLLPNKPRGVPRVDDRRVLNGIFWRLRTGAPWADIPARYGPHTTCVNRFNRWRKAGVWDRLLAAVSEAYDGDIQMIDSSSIRVHQHAANGKKTQPIPLHGPFAGRADDKDPRSCRCHGAADRFEAERRTNP